MNTTNKDLLKVIGFPRSGNTFLNFALQDIYYPDELVNDVHHIAIDISLYNKLVVPLRNPIDAIASWHLFAPRMKSDHFPTNINYYTEFHFYVLNNIDKVKILDFNIFTNNLKYIEDNVFDFFNIEIKKNTSIDKVKNNMINSNKEKNLPNQNKKELEAIKYELKQNNKIQECFEIYNKLKNTISAHDVWR